METLLSAIIGALGKLSEVAVKDAYESLKAIIHRKLGQESKLADALKNLEAKPESAGRKEVLKEEIEGAGANEDEDIVNAARILLEKLKALPETRQTIHQTVKGSHNIISVSGPIVVKQK